MPTLLVTGATGQLGRLTLNALRRLVPEATLVAAVRTPDKARDLADSGIEVRAADYDRPDTLAAAFAGVDRALLISSSEVGRRAPQHRAVIEAAKGAGVGLLAYTSLLRANTNPLELAAEHRETEADLHESGLPTVILRNGWYTENYAASIAPALAHGVFLGSAGDGRIASAARADYAEAAALVLAAPEAHKGKVYELAGDSAYTLTGFAAEVSRQAGKPAPYRDLPQAEYAAALLAAGLPEGFAQLLAESDAKAAQGALFDDGHQLSALIGRPTTPVARVIANALGALES